MTAFTVEIIHRRICRYSIGAENHVDAMERVLAGEGAEGQEDQPEPDIRVVEREG